MVPSAETHGALPGEKPRRVVRGHGWEVELLPSADLGNSSFLLVETERRLAAVIDPTRDVQRYLALLAERDLKLTWVLDTHLHNDFVSGGRELAQTAGARLGLSADAGADAIDRPLRDGERLDVGSLTVRAVSSPGHTPEHMSYIVSEGAGSPSVLFSGGSLMAGTAARADLLGPRFTYALAREEYRTLHERYDPLNGEVTVLPTHAGGSFCGTGAGLTAVTQLGTERRSNPLLRARTLESFLQAYLKDAPFPAYYSGLRSVNQHGTVPVLSLPPLEALSPRQFDNLVSEGGVTALDLRPPGAFRSGHIRGSLSLDPHGTFSAWVGWLRGPQESFVLIDDDPEVRRRVHIGLLRIGFDRVRGFLEGGVAGYEAAGGSLAHLRSGTMAQVRRAMAAGTPFTLLDVRHAYERAGSSLPGSVNIPLPALSAESTSRLPRDLPVYVHCQSGYRAGIAASLLEGFGFPDVVHVTDGPPAWEALSHARGGPARVRRRR